MQLIEYNDCYAFKRECAFRMKEKDMFSVDLGEGIIVTFGRIGSQKKNGGNVKLAEVAFLKDEFDEDEAYNIWRDFEFRYINKKYENNKKIPLCVNIGHLGNGEYVAIIARGTGKKMLFWQQLKMMEEGISPLDALTEEGHNDSEFDGSSPMEAPAKNISVKTLVIPRTLCLKHNSDNGQT